VGIRRRTESKECGGEGGVIVVCREGDSLRGVREVVEVVVVTLVWDDITAGRDRGGEPTEPLDNDGDRGRFGEVVVRAVEVAWCRNVGGSTAIAFAFTLLAAITAATLLFFVGDDTESIEPDNKVGLGHAFSSCLRALLSKPPIIDAPLSSHTAFSNQYACRAFSRTPGLGSPSAFLMEFTSVSRPPEVSMECLAFEA